MKMSYLTICLLFSSASTAVLSAEAGIGRENDNPGAQPPVDPAPAETSESLLQEMLESFGLTGDIEQ